MIVHLGQDASALAEDIVMILNIADGVPEETCAFLKVQRAAGRVEDISGGQAKTAVVLCGRRRGIRVLLSPISSATLRLRQSARGEADRHSRKGAFSLRAD